MIFGGLSALKEHLVRFPALASMQASMSPGQTRRNSRFFKVPFEGKVRCLVRLMGACDVFGCRFPRFEGSLGDHSSGFRV